MAEQLVVGGAADLLAPAAVEHLPQDPRDRGPPVVRHLVAAAGGPAPVAGAALHAGLARGAQVRGRAPLSGDGGLAAPGRRNDERLRRGRLRAVDRVGDAHGDQRRARLIEDRAAGLACDRVVGVLGQRRRAVELVVGLEAARRVAGVPIDLDRHRVDQAAEAVGQLRAALAGHARPRRAQVEGRAGRGLGDAGAGRESQDDGRHECRTKAHRADASPVSPTRSRSPYPCVQEPNAPGVDTRRGAAPRTPPSADSTAVAYHGRPDTPQ